MLQREVERIAIERGRENCYKERQRELLQKEEERIVKRGRENCYRKSKREFIERGRQHGQKEEE